MTPVLLVQGLCKQFGPLAVTRDVDLSVPERGLHAIIGPNGAGKTTLIHQLMGTLRPDAGRIILAGQDITRLAPHRRARCGLARTFQISQLVGRFTARENAALAAQARLPRPLRIWGRADACAQANAAADAALADVGLADRAKVPARDLSHGERRSLEIACALALAPRALLLDEPLAGTGHEEAAQLIALLGGLKRRLGLLLVEHDMDAVFKLADTVSVLVDGRIIATGTPAAIRADAGVRAAYLGEA
jgi:branched-chain amino acid transport system ATP-binding protein